MIITVKQVKYKGQLACLKKAQCPKGTMKILDMANTLEKLEGRGGAPLVLAVAVDGSQMVTTWTTGTTLQHILANPPKQCVSRWLRMIKDIAISLRELHQARIVHNNITAHHVIISERGDVSFVDYYLASGTGLTMKKQDAPYPSSSSSFSYYIYNNNNNNNKHITSDPQEPNITKLPPPTSTTTPPKKDIYSLGILIKEIMFKVLVHHSLTGQYWPLQLVGIAEQMTSLNPDDDHYPHLDLLIAYIRDVTTWN
ncbi:hypothetical protein Pmani_031319 [Petrolisthes manimaculis]|uniref:Protein kinase domain-containing protein n=1 Tax=Petrolisthes manimaculis TaxID=1843537 RepID=A0AAE1NU37_9EUCA|nr:hypothetical protein Pmani_031319 [Petrolisthes manimaculis]